MGRPPLLLGRALHARCMRCERSSYCQVEECAPGQDLCRTTVMRICEEEEELEVVERGCAYPEKTNRTMSYRTGLQIITLTETMCGGDFCNRPHPGRHAPSFPRSRYLECVSCASSDMSCERGREQSLQCGSPTEQCLEVVTYRSLEGEGHPSFCKRDLNDEQHTRGCGYLPGCPGPTGFHNNHTFHFLQCCNTTKCNGGPGPGTPSYTVRGCATDSWCQRVHVADAFSLTHINVTCCNGSGCNHPAWDVQHRRGGTPRPGPARLSLTVTLLLTARLWGGTLLWT
uniref:Urokinase plasminogen activator surface receptor n=1 Tax=Propithecus coquereli TaxID=379532 RepID=A0A2K6GFA1_PROCO